MFSTRDSDTPAHPLAQAFDLLDVDLAPYVKEPSMSLVLSGRGRQPPQNTTIEVTVKLLVGASL